MSLRSNYNSVHFQDPKMFIPQTMAATTLNIIDNAAATTQSNATAFFTEYAKRGLQDQTDWSSNTYKTLLSVSSGWGLVAGMIACTAGGAETTTFEITVDGVLSTITITNASGERALLTTGQFVAAAFTTAGKHASNALGTLGVSATTFASPASVDPEILHWGSIAAWGTPCLIFKNSLLIRAKHSAAITNSTATSYSGIMYRLGISS